VVEGVAMVVEGLVVGDWVEAALEDVVVEEMEVG
jgi:hypothetical protein